jgi:isopenicillin N synthase-like dioxygenase
MKIISSGVVLFILATSDNSSTQAFTMKPALTAPMESLIPLVKISANTDANPPSKNASQSLVLALQNSGFLLVQSPLLTPDIQDRAIKAANKFLEAGKSNTVVEHPSDPKKYAMLETVEECEADLKEYMHVLKKIKMDVLRHIAVGLGMRYIDFFAKLHDDDNDTLRLINYSPTNEDTGNRCKEHSDYGTITLLSTDGVSGLEAFHDGEWIPVPHVKGSLVVNIGTLLSGWTKGSLKATLHRVAGPASMHSQIAKKDLVEACRHTRTSIAFFADPNKDVSAVLSSNGSNEKEDEGLVESLQGMSVSEYVEWRSGGSGKDEGRSGIGFTREEKNLLAELNSPTKKRR